MKEITLTAGALFGALAVFFGAFAAHYLKKKFSADLQKSFETGVKYQMYHGVVLLLLGFNLELVMGIEKIVTWCFMIGTFLFSFSIYGLCLSGAKGNKYKFLGPITPLGGLMLIIGWVLLLYRFMNFPL